MYFYNLNSYGHAIVELLRLVPLRERDVLRVMNCDELRLLGGDARDA